jgi:hypothetical protein
MNKITENLRKELIRNSDKKTKEAGERFFREDLTLYGIKSFGNDKIMRAL